MISVWFSGLGITQNKSPGSPAWLSTSSGPTIVLAFFIYRWGTKRWSQGAAVRCRAITLMLTKGPTLRDRYGGLKLSIRPMKRPEPVEYLVIALVKVIAPRPEDHGAITGQPEVTHDPKDPDPIRNWGHGTDWNQDRQYLYSGTWKGSRCGWSLGHHLLISSPVDLVIKLHSEEDGLIYKRYSTS